MGWRLSHTLAARLLAADAKNHRIEPGKDVFKETIVGRQIERLAMEPYAYNFVEKSWKGPGATIYNIINPIGIYGDIAVAIGLSFSAWHLYKKLANLDAWQSGETTAYTKAVKPAFGTGLAAKSRAEIID